MWISTSLKTVKYLGYTCLNCWIECAIIFAQKLNTLSLCVADLHGGLVLVLSVVGLLFSQALAMLSVLFACEVMPTVVR